MAQPVHFISYQSDTSCPFAHLIKFSHTPNTSTSLCACSHLFWIILPHPLAGELLILQFAKAWSKFTLIPQPKLELNQLNCFQLKVAATFLLNRQAIWKLIISGDRKSWNSTGFRDG
jgi:hypothetical protein